MSRVNYNDEHGTGGPQQGQRRETRMITEEETLGVIVVLFALVGLVTISKAAASAFALDDNFSLPFLASVVIILVSARCISEMKCRNGADRACDSTRRRARDSADGRHALVHRGLRRTESGLQGQLIDAGFTGTDAAEAQTHSSTLAGCTTWLDSADALEGRLRRAGFSALDAGAALLHVPLDGGETQFAACLAWLYAPSAVRNMTAAEKAARGRRGLKSFLSMKSRKWSGKVSLLDIDCAMKRSSTVRGCVAWIESELERRRKHESELKWRQQHEHGIVGGRQMGKTAIAEFSSMRQIGKTEAAKEQMKAELIQDLIFDDDMPALVESSDSDGDSDESGEGDCMISFAACLEQSCSTQVDDDHMPVLDSRDVELVMQQAGVLRAAAVKALRANDGDVVNAAAKEQMKAELIQDLIFDDDMPALVESSDSDGDSDESGEGDCMISFAACLEQSCSTQVDDDHMPVLDSRDVELVMQQAGVLRAAAVKALRANDGDVVNAIMDLVMVPTKAVEEEDIID